MMAPLVLLPGVICDASVWAPQTEALSDLCEMRPVADFYACDSIETMAEQVLQAAPARFHLAGHSMGGRVALEIVDRAPERIASLAIFDTRVEPATPEEAPMRQTLMDIANTGGMAALAARWLPMLLAPAHAQDTALMASLTEMVCRATPGIFARHMHAVMRRSDARPMLPRIACPTLVACGRDDKFTPYARHEEIAAAISGAELAGIDGSGHMVTREEPTAVTALLRDWLTRMR